MSTGARRFTGAIAPSPFSGRWLGTKPRPISSACLGVVRQHLAKAGGHNDAKPGCTPAFSVLRDAVGRALVAGQFPGRQPRGPIGFLSIPGDVIISWAAKFHRRHAARAAFAG